MTEAIQQAHIAFKQDEVPVGAVIIDRESGAIIAKAGNETEQNNDPTAHAEMIALQKACDLVGSPRLNNCAIYVTLEPCPMCAQAISFARIHSLYYGASDPKSGGVEHGPRIFSSSSCHHKPEIYPGIHEKECSSILKNFFSALR